MPELNSADAQDMPESNSADSLDRQERAKTRRERARGCLTIVFAVSLVLSSLVFASTLLPVPDAIELLSDLLALLDIDLPDRTVARVQGVIQAIAPYALTGILLFAGYALGKIAGFFSRMGDTEQIRTTTRKSPVGILLKAVVRVSSQLLAYIGLLADAMEEITEGLLESFEYLYDIIERLLEYDVVRILVAALFSILSVVWLWFTVFFTCAYLDSGNLLSALQMLGSAGVAFSCQVCVVGTLRKQPFRRLALQQLRLVSNAGSFALILFLPSYFALTQINSFLSVGPITKVLAVLFVSLLLFELGRRIQEEVRGRSRE